ETICIFWFFPIEIRWLMLFYLIYDLHPVLLALSGDRFSTGIAHAAHLGGLAFGFAYAKFDWRLEPILNRFTARLVPRRPQRGPSQEPVPSSFSSRICIGRCPSPTAPSISSSAD